MAVSAYEVISTTILGSAASTITLSSIPQTYTDLVLISNHDAITADSENRYTVNGDNGSNYSSTLCWGQGYSVYSVRQTSQTSAFLSYGMNTTAGWGLSILQLQNYSNTTTYKSMISRESEPDIEAMMTVSLWRSTAAITEVSIKRIACSFATGSTFTLYGIKAA